MTRPLTIVFLACILAIPQFSIGSTSVPDHFLAKTLQPSPVRPGLHRSVPRSRKSSARLRPVISKVHTPYDEPVVVILYDVRPGSWM